MNQPQPLLKETPSQTAGPYVHIGCTPAFSGVGGFGKDLGRDMVHGPLEGEKIELRGAIYDGEGEPVRDAMVEIWQPDASGIFPSLNETHEKPDLYFTGWGRCPTDMETGEFSFSTVKPGPVPWPNGGQQAPHITVWIAARGVNIGLQTRLYFEDEGTANSSDPILSAIQDKQRVNTLMAQKIGQSCYRFDIHLQGKMETVFFDI